jgi:hypothetical protein|tara:strand:+ start:119 stop:244 length:126 start_codon:yes stop_codon:yes gene_type:complete
MCSLVVVVQVVPVMITVLEPVLVDIEQDQHLFLDHFHEPLS